MFTNSEKSIKKFTLRQKFEIGYRLMMGHSYSVIVQEYGVSQSYAYELKDFAARLLERLDTYDPDVQIIIITRKLIKKIVIGLAMFCRSPLEGISRFMEEVLHINMSVSGAGSILQETSQKAAEWDKTVSLKDIKHGANDEIFQCGKPILVGVDVDSTYAYLLEEKENRKGSTWKSTMEDAKTRGLNLKVCISDQGSGLLSGVPKAFPDADIQYDVFHEMMEIRKDLCRMEQHAFSHIRKEYEYEEKIEGARSEELRLIYEKRLEEAKANSAVYLEAYDNMAILHGWLRELLGFSGYAPQECLNVAAWVVDSMADVVEKARERDLSKKMQNLKEKLPHLLGFVRRLHSLMAERAEARGVSEQAYYILYHLRTHSEDTKEHSILSDRVDKLLKDQRTLVENELGELIRLTKRASSLVENLNSRIRMYIDLKRVIPKNFLSLMKVFFNTKKYRRSAIENRVGKSPYELLTGKECPDFFELVAS